ncbi:MAG: two-component system sensor histidine kinase NtrB [Planctomycetota bacterium]
MADETRSGGGDTQESVWIEIAERMEALYAELAGSQEELERNARELSEAKELSDNIIRSMSNGLIALDSAGTITLVNQAAEWLFGFSSSDLTGQCLDVLLPEESGKQWRWHNLGTRVRQSGAIRDAETTWRDRRGALIPVSVSCTPLKDVWGGVVGAVLVVRDLRETKRHIAEARAATAAAEERARELEKVNVELTRLQAELIQVAKMSSIGTLAAGVAHELNNPLGGILLYSDLLLEDTPPDDPRRDNVEKISALAARCRNIVSGLLDFARPAPPGEFEVDVNGVLKSTVSVLEGHELFHNIEVKWDLAPDLAILTADPAQFQQAFTNVVINAAEAMEGEGALSIGTVPSWDRKGVVVKIADTGRGIRDEDKECLFEPFFTTKDEGTGLGLAITYSIVEGHNGSIEVESEVGKGTMFIVTLRSARGAKRDAE